MRDSTQGADLFGGVDEARDVAEVFGNSKDGFRGEIVVEGDEFLGSGDIFGDGFFGKDVFSCGEGGFDVGWLGNDGECDDEGLDVCTLEKVLEVLVGIFRV